MASREIGSQIDDLGTGRSRHKGLFAKCGGLLMEWLTGRHRRNQARAGHVSMYVPTMANNKRSNKMRTYRTAKAHENP